MIEIWKDIDGYEGLYQVSNMGRVKSLNYKKTGKEKIMKSVDSYGYLRVYLYNKGKDKCFLVHRLVAEAFIPNPENKPEVNHINTVRDDNRVWVNEDGSIDYEKSNLEWCTRIENNNNPLTKEHYSAVRKGTGNPNYGKIGKNNPSSKLIIQLSKTLKVVNLFYGFREAERITGINYQNISACCREVIKTCGGYKWRYLDDYLADWWEEEMDAA